jgi:hypothetical protein
VAGTLSGNATTGRGTATYTFTRATSGAAVDCPANTPFVPDFGVQGRARVQIFTFGRNDGPNNVATTVLPFLASAAAFQTAYVPRFLVGGILPAPGETLSAFAAGNAQIAAAGRVALSIWGPCPRLKKWRPSASSRQLWCLFQRSHGRGGSGRRVHPVRHALGRNDRKRRLLHLNNFGYSLWALRYYRAIVALGWWPTFPPSEETTPWSTLASILPFPLPETGPLAALGRRR